MKFPAPSTRPRLCWSRQQLERFHAPPAPGFPGKIRRCVLDRAKEELSHPDWFSPASGHNWHLIRAREAQGRMFRAIAAWTATGKTSHRDEITRLLFQITGVEYWSWVAWRNGDAAPDAIFDLSYGEHAATLAFLYDWVGDALTREEREALVRAARERAFAGFLKPFRTGEKHSWWEKTGSNWVAVCTGGAGLLALVLLDDIPEAREVLKKADAGMRFYMNCMAPDGGWVEGLGYWNYGHYYAFRYLLSWENAFGQTHPMLRKPSARNTLEFPLLFTPCGVSSSFGDVARFQVMPFQLLAALRFRKQEVAAELCARLSTQWRDGEHPGKWPVDTEAWLAWPDTAPAAKAKPQRPFARRLQMGWAVLADRWPRPSVYLSLRGGSSEVPHAHRDLSSFEAVIDGERLLGNVRNVDYLDTTFSPRRYELYEMTQSAKNVLLLNGVGFQPPAVATPQPVNRGAVRGFILDLSECMGTVRGQRSDGGPVAACRLYRRGYYLTPAGNLLIIDRVIPGAEARVEVRLHTEHTPLVVSEGWQLRRVRAEATVRVFANVPIAMAEGKGCLNSPSAPDDFILRAITQNLVHDAFFVTLISRRPDDFLICEPQDGKWKIRIGSKNRVRESLVLAKNSLRPSPPRRT